MQAALTPAEYNRLMTERKILNKIISKNREYRFSLVLSLIKKELKKNPEKEFFLDIGCREGFLLEKTKLIGLKVKGIDISDKSVNLCREKGLDIIKANLEKKLPFENASFDIVSAQHVIEHLADTEFLIKEINRVLKKNGILVIGTPNLASLGSRLRLLFGFYPLQLAPCYNWSFGMHLRLFTIPTLKKVLKRNKFKVEKVTGTEIYLNPCTWKKGLNSRLLAKLFPQLAQKIIVKARKR